MMKSHKRISRENNVANSYNSLNVGKLATSVCLVLKASHYADRDRELVLEPVKFNIEISKLSLLMNFGVAVTYAGITYAVKLTQL